MVSLSNSSVAAPATAASANKPSSTPNTKVSAKTAPAAGGRARTYEIHRQTNGRWLLDSVADDKDVAIAMAKALLQSSRAPSEVRVAAVQIKLDGEFSEVTIFRGTPDDVRQAGAETRQPKRGAESGNAHPLRRGKDEPAAKTRASRQSLDLTRMATAMKAALVNTSPRVWLAIGGVLLWCAIFYVWRQPQTPWAFDSPAAQTVGKQHVPLPN
jgi:hypothetical protein